MEAGSTSGTEAKMRNLDPLSQLTCSRAPRERQYYHPCGSTLLVARNEHMGRKIHHWMCSMSTKQDMHHQKEDPLVSDPRRLLNVSFQQNCLRISSHSYQVPTDKMPYSLSLTKDALEQPPSSHAEQQLQGKE